MATPKGIGWAVRVTGRNPRIGRRTWSFQLWGKDAADKAAYDAIFSGLYLQLEPPLLRPRSPST